MNLEETFHGLLGLDEGWEVCGVEYEQEEERFVLVIAETPQLWLRETCPHEGCHASGITCYDHAPTRSWRHLDVFGKRAELLCNVPRGKCPQCGKVYRVTVPWEGRGKHFTPGFEGFALALMREMPVSKAAEIIGETDSRMWRLLFAHVEAAYAALDLSGVVWIGVDEMNRRKGHNYLTVFADLLHKRVIFATEGKDAKTFEAFVQALGEHNGHAKAITQAAIDMSKAYRKGVRENLGNAQVVFDKFHVVAQVSDAVDQVRRAETKAGDATLKAQLKESRWVFLKNPENLTEKQQAKLEGLDVENLATALAYQMRLNLQRAYRCRTALTARKKFSEWCRWVKRKAEKAGALLHPMVKVAEMIERHLEGILAHWQAGLTTAFMEGLNSVFSAVKRKARGYRSSSYMIKMLYFVAGKLAIPTRSFH
jgi:transposase